MTNRSKAVGTATESAVVGFLRDNGWPHAERRALAGSTDLGDITGIPGLVVEVKGGEAARRAINQPALITSWLQETETERRNARADIGVLVIVRGGFGARNVGKWWAVIPHRLIADLSRGRTITGGYPDWIAPCFMELAALLPLLRVAGYGTPLEAEGPFDKPTAAQILAVERCSDCHIRVGSRHFAGCNVAATSGAIVEATS